VIVNAIWPETGPSRFSQTDACMAMETWKSGMFALP
jgi:hypothetical protein